MVAARVDRVFYYDPTIVVPFDLKDHKGRVFHKAGTRFNPLTVRALTKSLIFIDARENHQLQWFVDYIDAVEAPYKLILVGGSPTKLSEQLGIPCFFDQHGVLTHKLGIKAVPAVVKQDGVRLRIEELARKH